jgi:hypothetical protein
VVTSAMLRSGLMNFSSFSPLFWPAVVAAGVSGVVSIVGMIVSNATARRLHTDKLSFDRQLAERKFEFDKELAERKFRYDRELHDHKRRIDLAEEVLSGSYQFRTALRAIRSPLSYNAEANSRQRESSETPAIAQMRDSYFVHLKRLEQRRDQIQPFLTKRHRMRALLGPSADKPFEQLNDVIADVTSAAQMLLMASSEHQQGDIDPQSKRKWMNEMIAGASKPDPIEQRVDAAICELEHICTAPFWKQTNGWSGSNAHELS